MTMRRLYIGIIGFVVIAVFVGTGIGFAQESDNQSDSSYDVSHGSQPDTAHDSYTPPESPPPPEMHPDSDRNVEQRDGEDHSPEDETTKDSIGKGQDEETPEAP
jgi:hypothetical protein